MKRFRKNSHDNAQTAPYPDLSPTPTPIALPGSTEWASVSHRLPSLLDTHSLPLVVKCDKRDLPSLEQFNFDFSQPLLLHTQRTVRKVSASNVFHVQSDEETKLEKVGESLLIPEDYKGWFAVLGQPQNVPSDIVVPHFRQVAQLALSNCTTFLIGGHEQVRAIQRTCSDKATSLTQTRHVNPGDVLRMGKLYVGETTVKKSKLLGGKKTVMKEEKFLLCYDENDRELYLPVNTQGVFYSITTDGNRPPTIPIQTMADILTHFTGPCVVKLLFGRIPATPCSFTGLLLLRGYLKQHSVIGSTILNRRNILLDVPVDSDLKFFLATPTADLVSSSCYENAVLLCQEKMSTYMRDMKVAYSVPDDEGEAGRESSEHSLVDRIENVVQSDPSDSQSHVSIASDQDEFCSPEASQKPDVLPMLKSVERKQSKKAYESSVQSSALSCSPSSLREDDTFVLLENPDHSFPSESPKQSPQSKRLSSSRVKNRPLPPVCGMQMDSSRQSETYISMAPSSSTPINQSCKPTADVKKPPPTAPKPSTFRLPSNTESQEGHYSQIWGAQSADRSRNEPPPNRCGSDYITADFHELSISDSPLSQCRGSSLNRKSSFAFAGTYLTLPMLKETPDTGLAKTAAMGSFDFSIGDSSHKRGETGNEPKGLVASSNYTKMNPKTMIKHSYETMFLTRRVEAGADSHPYNNDSSFQIGEEPTVPGNVTRFPETPDVDPPPLPPRKPASRKGSLAIYYDDSYQHTNVPNQKDRPPTPTQRSDVDAEQDQTDSDSEIDYENVNNLHVYQATASESRDSVSLGIVGTDQSPDRPGEERSMSEEPPPLPPRRPSSKYTILQSSNMKSSFESTSSDNVFLSYTPRTPPGLRDSAFTESSQTLSQPSSEPPYKPSFKQPTSRVLPQPSSHPSSQPFTRSSSQSSIQQSPPPSSRDGTRNQQYSHPADRTSQSDTLRDSASFCSSSEDDLPVGATFAHFIKSDSGCALESRVGLRPSSVVSSAVSSLSVQNLVQELRELGVTQDTLEVLQREKVDGPLLMCLDDDVLIDSFPGLKKLDVKKISMFKSGWRPKC